MDYFYKGLCEKCGISFTFRKDLYRHLRVLHDMEVNLNKDKEMCNICDKLFSSVAALERHKKTHRPAPRKLMCTECGIFTCRTREELRGHLTREHGIHMESKEMEFDSMEQFFRWKLKMECEEGVFFTKRTGERRVGSKRSRLYYICHRTRTTVKTSLGKRLRAPSSKIDQTCPACLIVTKLATGNISVTFHMTHTGHKFSVSSRYNTCADITLPAEPINTDDTVVGGSAAPRQQDVQHRTPGPVCVTRKEADAMSRTLELEHSVSDWCSFDALCEKCGISFRFRKELYCHLRLFHDIDNNLNKGKETCDVCDKMFSSVAELQHHKKMHRSSLQKLSCTECGVFTCCARQELRSHLECEHGINMETKEMSFDSMEQFLQWKSKMEDDESIFFTKTTDGRMVDSKMSCLYYVCDNTQGTVRSSSGKILSATSTKISHTCPASLTVRKMVSDKISVTYHMTHMGHSLSMRSLHNACDDRAMIAGQIEHGSYSIVDVAVIEDTDTPWQEELQCSTPGFDTKACVAAEHNYAVQQNLM